VQQRPRECPADGPEQLLDAGPLVRSEVADLVARQPARRRRDEFERRETCDFLGEKSMIGRFGCAAVDRTPEPSSFTPSFNNNAM